MKIGLSFSAGIDSTVVLALLKACGADPTLIVIDNGLLGLKLEQAVKEIAEHYDVEYLKLDAPFFKQLQFPAPNLYTPGFRLLLTQLALAACEKIGAHVLYTGCEVADDEDLPRWSKVLSDTGTADQREIVEESAEAWRSYAEVYQRTYNWEISIIHPFYLTKAHILRLGLALDVPVNLTFSCFNSLSERGDDGRWLHCSKCRGCIARHLSFKKLNVEDPTLYAEDPGKYICFGGNYR